jgi:membrane protease YdiL (CAAX protease family)
VESEGAQCQSMPCARPERTGLGEVSLAGLSRRAALADIALVLLFFGLEYAATRAWTSAYAWRHPPPLDYRYAWLLPWALGSIVGLMLAAFLTRRAGLSARAIGLRREDMSVQVCWGLLGGATGFGVLMLGVAVQLALHTRWPGRRTVGFGEALCGADIAGVLVTIALAAADEEALFRGVILPRLRRLTGKWWPAVAACSLLFGGYHLGGGVGQAAIAASGSVVFCVVFIRTRSLASAIVAHFGCNVAVYAWDARH